MSMKTCMAALALCAAPLLAQASNCIGDNADGNYILGTAEGTASAMHWPTGLVWKRCIEGEAFSGGTCTTAWTTKKYWHEWADMHLPQAFASQASWGVTVTDNPNRLTSGDWRMAYKNELTSITQSCNNNPKVNRTVFPGTPSDGVWSGSPYASTSNGAWDVNFGNGYVGSNGYRYSSFHVRLVRAGQSFASLNASPITQNATAGTTAVGFTTTITLASAAGTTAWGGVRFQNGSSGSPQLRVNGGAWVTEAIVKTGDTIAVRMDAPATVGSSHTATLTVRSGQTTGTNADGSNGGDESTKMEETTATFTLNAIENGTCGSAHNPGILLTSAPTANLCNAGASSPVAGGGEKWSWTCEGSSGGSHAACEAPRGYTVTPTVQGTGGSIDPDAPQTVAYGTEVHFRIALQPYHDATASGCGGNHLPSLFTTAPVRADCTVEVTFTPTPGQCGSAHGGTFPTTPSANLCDAGTASPVTRGAGWTWSCAAATTASCSASVTTHAIAATPQPSFAGTVSCTPNPVPHGASTTCVATPEAGYEFDLWDMIGPCDASTASTCRLDGVTGEEILQARFIPKTYTISASVQPPGAGRVICPLGPLPHGVSVACQAVAGAYPLAGWEGCSRASGSACELDAISAAPTVVARFDTSRVIDRPLNDTGVPFSGAAGSGNASTCDDAHPDGQDCHYGRDAGAASGQLAKTGASTSAASGFDYTKIANDGSPLPASAPLGSGPGDWACTRDNATGLVWEVKTISAGARDATHTYTWHDPRSPNGQPGTSNGGMCGPDGSCDTAGFADNINVGGLCGAHDWRVPSVQELESLLHLGGAAGLPAIDTGYFPNTPALPFWSSTPLADYLRRAAWAVNFEPLDDGAVYGCGAARACPLGHEQRLHVRLVRGAQK